MAAAAPEPYVTHDAVDPPSRDWRLLDRRLRPYHRNVHRKRGHSFARSTTAARLPWFRRRRDAGWGGRWRTAARHRPRRRARQTCRASHHLDEVPCGGRHRHCRHSAARRLLGEGHAIDRPQRAGEPRSGQRPMGVQPRSGQRPMGEQPRPDLTTRARQHCSGCETRRRNLRHAEGRDVAYRSSRPCAVQDTRSRAQARTRTRAPFPTVNTVAATRSGSPLGSAVRVARGSQITPSQSLGSPEAGRRESCARFHDRSDANWEPQKSSRMTPDGSSAQRHPAFQLITGSARDSEHAPSGNTVGTRWGEHVQLTP